MKTAWFYPLVRLTARVMFGLTRVTVTGRENFPDSGPMLVCANHLSSADPPLLGLNVPRNPVYFLAKKELFSNSFFSRVLKGSGTIPLNRAGVSGASFKLSQSILKKGGAIIIFPEGKRNPAGQLSAALPGAAYLAASFNVPILPVAISGTEEIRGTWWFLKPRRVIISFGKPYMLLAEGQKVDKDDLDGHARRIMRSIAELLPPAYRGSYGEAA